MNSGAESGVDRARRDVATFAEVLLGTPLWPHQLRLVKCPARYVATVAGRQVGKSRVLAVAGLHKAFSRAGSTTLVVSAGDTASKRLLEEVAGLATSSPLLRGSVVDETAQVVTLSNGSVIRGVPASPKQIRGWAIDLLIVDEAGFIGNEVWQAAEPTIVARPGSRVIACSTPWGAADQWFRVLWHRGMAAPDEHLSSFHFPSSMSPLVDRELLERIAERESPATYAREYLAEWTDPAGAYFTPQELDDAPVCELLPPGEAISVPAVGGVDWAFSRDASTLAVVSAAAGADRPRYAVTWLIEEFRMPFAEFIGRVVDAAADPENGCGYAFRRLVSELNGVGSATTQELSARMAAAGRPSVVEGTFTDNRLKQDAFGFVRLLLQQGRLELPRHPALLRQLAALEFETTETGAMRLSVPERQGHDDLAMALCLAASALMADDVWMGGALGAPIEWPRALPRVREIDWMTEPM